MTNMDVKAFLVVAMLCFAAAISIVYFPITKYDIYDSATGGNDGDVAQYVRMFEGVSLKDVPKPYRYRVLTPYLARLVPWLPRSVANIYEVSPEKIIKFKFGVINMLSLACTGMLLFVLCRSLSFSALESLLASYLFFTSFHVVNYGGVPLVDALAYFFLVLGLLSVLKNWYGMLFIAASVGLFAKETSVLIVLAVMLVDEPIKKKIEKLCCCLPGLIAYLVFRFFVLPTDVGYNYSVSDALQGIVNPSQSAVYIVIDGGLAFGFLWFLGLYGLFLIKDKKDNPLVRLAILIPITMIVPFLIGSNIGRIWFLAFPIIIPLSIIGIRGCFRSNKRDGAAPLKSQ